jgi:hypothetical protein
MKKISKVSAIVFLLYIVIIENTVENLRSRSPEGEKKIARNSEGTVFFKNLLKRNARPPCSWEYGPESGPYSTNLKITPTALRERIGDETKKRHQKKRHQKISKVSALV